MKTSPILSSLLFALILCNGRLEAQQVQRDQGERQRFSLAPFVGPTWFGHRYELVETDPQDREGEVTLGPTTGLELGLALEVRPWDRFALAFTGSWAGLDYVLEAPASGDRSPRSIAGSQSVVRLSGSVRYRIVPQAPGFFSAGLLVNRFDAGRPAHVTSAENRTEVGGFGGLGLDIGGGTRRLRAEGRLMVVAPGGEARQPTTPFRSGMFEPRSVALDYSLTLSFVFGI